MVKITIESEAIKQNMSGKCIFVAVIDSEGAGDMATALIGETSPHDLADTLGKCIGAQIKAITPDFMNQIKLIDILVGSTAKGMYGDVKVVKADIE